MRAILDFSNVYNVNNSAYNTTNKYVYVVKSDEFIILTEISLSINGNMASDGRIKMVINGQAITSNNENPSAGEVPLRDTSTFNFNNIHAPTFIPKGSTIEIDFRTTGLTGEAQVQLSGSALTRNEYNAIRKKLGFEV